MASQSLRSRAIQNKLYLRLGAIVAVIAAVAVGAAYVTTGNSKPKRGELPATKTLNSGLDGLDKKRWESTTGAEITALRKEFSEFRRQQAGGPTRPSAAASSQPAGLAQPDDAAPKEDTSAEPSSRTPGPPEKPKDNYKGSSFLDQLRKPKAPELRGAPPKAGLFTQAGGEEMPPPTGAAASAPAARILASMPMAAASGPAQASSQQDDQGQESPEGDKQTAASDGETYVPAGTYVRVMLLAGLDAPAGGQAQANAAPVFLSAISDGRAPNGYKVSLKGCAITGNGYGELSSERANLRTDRISCVGAAGAADIAVKGYIVGEDGKQGVRGTVVTKTGQVLANALYASVGSGFAAAFRAEGISTTTNAFGTTETTNDAFKAGVGTGLGKSFDKLSDYYLKLADKMFPVIEVSGSRVVEVVFTKGFVLPAVNGTKKLKVAAGKNRD